MYTVDPSLAKIADTDLDVFPLCLGGNVFGWTAAEPDSVLDTYVAAGGNFIDTADAYGARAPGAAQSETIIGDWMARRRNRDSLVIATKVGASSERKGLRADNIHAAIDDSLRRLQTDHVDLYYAHIDDQDTPLEETLGAFGELIRAGKVRHAAASNYTAPRLGEALDLAARDSSLARYVALQPHYNLVEREIYEGELQELCEREGVACIPYFALARGFLTGKYRGAHVDSPRAERARAYMTDRGVALLELMDEIAAAHGTTLAAVAIAWLRSQPTVVAPIASARSAQQLAESLPGATLELSGEELDRLSGATAYSERP
jgi:aryl-alcohol dehydrogenase-like predicted oxidoreductase